MDAAPTAATGIAIGHPERGAEILFAIRASGGTVLSVSEEEIREARKGLAQRGFYVEDTSAVAAAALVHLSSSKEETDSAASIVVLLTGHGLKIDPG